jgi:DNA-binding transcriptional ArsR family regulator
LHPHGREKFSLRRPRFVAVFLRVPLFATPQKNAQKTLANNYTLGCNVVMDQLTDVLTAISHPTRRAIIGQLANGPARFLDVAKPFDTALNAVTKHLKLLERAGLIERRKQGREVFISFRGEPLREVAGWVHEYERFWNQRLDQFEQYFRDKKKKEKK